ncbi:excisionase family DNA-binding protein [Paraburkholderia aspalathi]|uniref:DNA binding domain-containing protein, excisionase family n=1 Tax=Paraburkholderia aspalathi TaxID=1324617 RepID=A0A1I7ER08_9BURK|nr:excisionase family DNA-binding protein [Paraburkholderia aspalathi]SFU26337.1 DNA binding domain-containing protein, excisionase family [Paraburkholderia aspalathi]
MGRKQNPDSDHDAMTISEAAKLLHVSRTQLDTLIDEGKLDAVRYTQGGHRRIQRAALLAYKEEIKTTQKKGLNRMVEASECMGLYETELEELPVRRKS